MSERDEARKTGKFLRIPYDFRRPDREKLRRGLWNPDERRVFIPKVYGWGYGINLHEIARRLGLTNVFGTSSRR